MARWLPIIFGIVVAIAIPLFGIWYARPKKPDP